MYLLDLPGEIINVIFSFPNINGSEYKAIIITSMELRTCVQSHIKTHYYMNALSTYIMHHLCDTTLKWNLPKINKYAHMNVINMLNESQIDWWEVSCNNHLTNEFIIKNRDKIDDENLFLDGNMNSRLAPYFENSDKLTHFYGHPNVTLDIIEDHIAKGIVDWDGVWFNHYITREFFIKYHQHLSQSIFMNSRIPLELIERFLIAPSRVKTISHNLSLYAEFIDNNVESLNWSTLSRNCALTLPLIRKYIDKVKFRELSRNHNLTREFIEEYADKLDWSYLSTWLPECDLVYFVDKIDWYEVQYNNAITMQFIEKHKDQLLTKPNYRLLLNPNVTLAFIEDNIMRFGELVKPNMIAL